MATGVDQQEYVDDFEQFFRDYYRDEVGALARAYPSERKSLSVDWEDLYRFDRELAEAYLEQPEQYQRCAEEALRLYDLPIDVSLGQAHVRIRNLPEVTDIRSIRSSHVNTLVSVRGIVRKATDVRPKCTEAAFRCVRCESLTRVPQDGGSFQEPHECRSCERQGPFRLNEDQSEFVDAQRLRVQESPEGLRGGETPQAIDVDVEDDITGEVTPGDHVAVVGILRLDQEEGKESPIFDVHMEGVSVEVEEEQFEDMDITDEDTEQILELAGRDDVYEQMVAAIAPSIHGYDEEKLAMTFQLFSGVTKHLPDESRIRGDLHILLIGDPGTGKCVRGDTTVTLGDGTPVPIRDLVESNLDDPVPVDDGVYDSVDFEVPSMTADGTMIRQRATKVWKREAPDRLYRVRTTAGRELEVTPSHPLFVESEGRPLAKKAETLSAGDLVAVPTSVPVAGSDGSGVLADGGTAVAGRNLSGRDAAGTDIGWDRIESIEPVEHDDEWVYDLEVAGTHSYVSGGVISHNSQLLQYVRNIAPRSVYTSGKGSSSAGLTAAAVRDDFAEGNQWTLEAGALVLADQGVAAVDELDKMRCVTGDSLVHLGDGRVSKIRDLALEAAEDGSVEPLSNGRTIRDVDLEAWTMDDTGTLVRRPVTAIHEYDAPETLTSVTLESGETVTATDDHPFFVLEDGERVERAASDLSPGDWTYVPRQVPAATDGGVAVPGADSALDTACEAADGDRTTLDVVPDVGPLLGACRESLRLHVSECGIVDSTYCNVEGGEANVSIHRARRILDAFETRRSEAREDLDTLGGTCSWEVLAECKRRYNVSRSELARDTEYTQQQVSRLWGEDERLRRTVGRRLVEVVEPVAETDLSSLRRLVRADVAWRRIDAVDSVPAAGIEETDHRPRVYDLTVEGTHNFVADGMVVHNSEDRSAMHEALEQQSYHPDTEILLADGRRVEIGDLVDDRMSEQPQAVVDGVDCEILPTDDLRVHTVDLNRRETTKASVDRVSRHEAPDEFVRVTFSNGRRVTVTPEHPMFAGVDEETVPAGELEEGDFVPAPRELPNSPGGVGLEATTGRPREKEISPPESMTPALAEFLGLFVAEGHSYAGSSHEIGFSNQDERLLARAEQLGQSVFGFESNETVNDAGTVTKRWISTQLYRWFDANVPEVMETARDKRIPATVLGSSREIIRRFLVGAFAGDGGVESEAMSFATASPGLAEDYADALAKIGVASRIHHDAGTDSYKTYVMGDSTESFVDAVVEAVDDRYDDARSFVERSTETPRHHDVLPPSAAEEVRSLRRLVGLPLTGRYKPNVDERYGVQIGTVRAELSEVRDRIQTVRRAVEDAASLASVRAAIGWSGRQLADRIEGETTSSIHYAEDGGYDETRRTELAAAARNAVEEALDLATHRIQEMEESCELRYYRVRDVETVPNQGDDATEWVYDVTVEPTNTFVSKGVVLHNSISISKAGINATLKSRCSLLGAANPKYGRFDQYEPIGEQIDLEPALISRFDLIFTVTDQPDPEEDRELAEHILEANYAGQLNTQREKMPAPDVTREEVEAAQETVEPSIEPELLRKYVAYAQQTCYPRMTDEAREAIQEFYVDLRSKGADEDAPVPVTARKLEALVRLAEASARVRLADEVTREDAERVIAIVRSCLQDIGVDPETGQFDADVVETGTSKSQRDRIKNLKALVDDMAEEYEEGVPVDALLDRAEEVGIGAEKAERELEKLKTKGEIYEPRTDHVRTT